LGWGKKREKRITRTTEGVWVKEMSEAMLRTGWLVRKVPEEALKVAGYEDVRRWTLRRPHAAISWFQVPIPSTLGGWAVELTLS
jgi:hypothetical protein